MNILPEPREREILQGKYNIKKEYNFEDDNFPRVYKYLSTFVKLSKTGERILCRLDANLKREEYVLLIEDSIWITARDEEGVFRAITTLKQLFVMDSVEKQRIHDYPMIQNRGFMLDVSRGKLPKYETIIELINILRDVKYNQLQLYIDGLFFEYPHFKKYLKEDSYITINEIKKIKRYCKDNFIDLIPTQNGFGHMEKWLEIDEFRELGINRDDGEKTDTINPCDEKSLELIDTIYSDILPYYDSQYVNICMDEPFALGMGQTKEICQEEGRENVYLKHLNKVIGLATKKYNRTPMFFDDVVIEHEEVIDNIDKNSIIMVWGYELEWPYFSRCELLKRKGRRFYVCPSTCTFLSITGRFSNMAYNVEKAVKACIMYGGEGMLMTEWGDGGHPQCLAMSFVPAVFAASCAWNYKTEREIIPINHLAYDRNSDIIGMCEEYADKFIFGQDGVSGLIHLMQNYYLLENHLKWSGTYIGAYPVDVAEGRDSYLNKVNLQIIINYMEQIRVELKNYSNAKYADDIILNCDAIILIAKFIYEEKTNNGRVKNDFLKMSFVNFRAKFLEQWCIGNQKSGSEIFCGMIDTIIDKFE